MARQQGQDRAAPRGGFRTWKTICTCAAGCSALQLPDPSVSTSLLGLGCSSLGTLELGACALWSLLLSGKVADCSGSSLGLQGARGGCDTSGLVAGGLAVAGCGAARCEHAHSRRIAGAAGRERCPVYQDLCPKHFLSSTGAANFCWQRAIGANPDVCSMLSCLIPCRKAVCRVLVAACCVLAAWPRAFPAAPGGEEAGCCVIPPLAPGMTAEM